MLDLRGKVFTENIIDRVDKSTAFIKTQYSDFDRFEIAMDFMAYDYTDGVKADFTQLERVGYYPSTEVEMELDYAIKHALIGSYKAAFSDLRRGLELSLIGIYLCSEHKKLEEAKAWLNSELNSPMFSNTVRELVKSDRFKSMNETLNWGDNLKNLYWTLSDYSHNKGQLNGYRNLNRLHFRLRGTDYPSIKTETLYVFCDYYIQVVEQLVTMLALYNPIILVGLPIDEKFGLNPPASGFYYASQAERAIELIPKVYSNFFYELIKNDEEVIGLVDWFKSQPDCTEEEIEAQAKSLEDLYGKNIK